MHRPPPCDTHEAYRQDLLAAVERTIALSPVVPVRDGTYHSVIPFACDAFDGPVQYGGADGSPAGSPSPLQLAERNDGAYSNSAADVAGTPLTDAEIRVAPGGACAGTSASSTVRIRVVMLARVLAARHAFAASPRSKRRQLPENQELTQH